MSRKHYSAEEKANLLNSLTNSTLSKPAFAKANGISLPTLYNWVKALSDQTEPVFTEISISAPEPPIAFGIRVGRLQIEFASYPDAIWFSQVLQSLGQ